MTNQDQDKESESETSKKPSPLMIARRSVAIALFTSWLAVLWISFLTPHLHTCSDEVARVGSTALATSCGPLSITDAPSLALIISACALLVPDLSALEISGLFRLERQIKEQEVRQQQRQAEIVGLIQRLEVRQNVYNVFGIARLAELVGEQDEKRQRFDTDAS
jgi:hypothetical protein